MLVDFFRFPLVTARESDVLNLELFDFKTDLAKLEHPSVSHSLVALFDSDIVYRESQVSAIAEASHSGNWSFAFRPEITGNRGEQQIDAAVTMGCKALVFHPYLQKISRNDLPRVQALARYADSHGLFICVCAAYGSRDIYRYQPLESVVACAEAVNCPVIIIHGGGAKILDAFLVAEAFSNIYLDTSFSLPYWIGSSIEEQFAFAIQRLGAQRWMFGSDSPFQPVTESIEAHYAFFKRHNISSTGAHLIMGGNAATLLEMNK